MLKYVTSGLKRLNIEGELSIPPTLEQGRLFVHNLALDNSFYSRLKNVFDLFLSHIQIKTSCNPSGSSTSLGYQQAI